MGDETLSVLEIWGAEYQENNALLIKASDQEVFELRFDRRHPFFKRLGDWDALAGKLLPVPWVPPLEADNDLAHFESYSDAEDSDDEPLPAGYTDEWCADF